MRFRSTIAVRLAVIGAINVIIQDELMYAIRRVTLGRSPRGRQSANVIHIGMKLPGTPAPPSELISYNACVDDDEAPLSKKMEKYQRYGADRSESPKLCLSLRIRNPKASIIKIVRASNSVHAV
jgi:hypothetical protein